MRSAWRELLSKVAIGCVGISSLTAASGCQSWSPSSLGMPTSTRVPPPPTGTVQPQGAYYSNPGTATGVSPAKVTSQNVPSAAAPVVQASAVDPFGANGSMPATNMSANGGAFTANATSIGFQGAGGQVSTAGYNDNGSGMAQVVTAASLQGTPNLNSDNGLGGNASVGEDANLQWTGK